MTTLQLAKGLKLSTRATESFTKEEIGEAVGLTHTSGTFGTYLSALTSNNLVARHGNTYRISEDLFA